MATRKDGFEFPCGQCLNCRINKRRDWQARLLLEAATHEYGVFVTLTFRDVGVPQILSRSHVREFVKSLRVHLDFRYFCAAEYGTRFGRAHYHIHLFSDRLIEKHTLSECWPFGDIHLGDSEPASLDYTLGYLLKDRKATTWPVESRYPEFRCYSQGLGKLALPHLLIDGTELPRQFRVFGNTWPIGRYLRDRAKKHGYTVTDRDEIRLEKIEAQALRSMSLRPGATPEEIHSATIKYMDDRLKKRQIIRNKAIRDAYREKLTNQRKQRHETF